HSRSAFSTGGPSRSGRSRAGTSTSLPITRPAYPALRAPPPPVTRGGTWHTGPGSPCPGGTPLAGAAGAGSFARAGRFAGVAGPPAVPQLLDAPPQRRPGGLDQVEHRLRRVLVPADHPGARRVGVEPVEQHAAVHREHVARPQPALRRGDAVHDLLVHRGVD